MVNALQKYYIHGPLIDEKGVGMIEVPLNLANRKILGHRNAVIIPGSMDAVFGPLSLMKRVNELVHAIKRGDRKTFKELVFHISLLSFSTLYGVMAFCSLTLFVLSLISVTTLSGALLALPLFTVGLIICGVGLGLQLSHLKEMHSFKKNLSFLNSKMNYKEKVKNSAHNLEILDKKFITLDHSKLEKIRNAIDVQFTSSSNTTRSELFAQEVELRMSRRYEKLVRLIQPRLAIELLERVPHLIEDLKSGSYDIHNRALEESIELTRDIKIQCIKTQLFHGVAIIALSLAIGTIFIGLLPITLLVGCAFTALATALTTGTALCYKGFANSKGLKIEIRPLVPDFILNVADKLLESHRSKQLLALSAPSQEGL